MIVHGGLLARRLAGRWRGALIEGPSGCGKSDLALRLLDQGFRLVADDRVLLWTAAGALFGRAPATLFGLMEVRGQGVVPTPALSFAEVVMIARPGAPERLPDHKAAEILGVRLPVATLPYLEPSAPAKLRRALAALYVSGERRM